MKFLTMKKNNQMTLGIKTEKGIIDIEEALKVVPNEKVQTNIMDVIAGGSDSTSAIKEFIQELPVEKDAPYVKNEDELEWGACVPQPNKIICVGLNYRKHADETNAAYPEVPILFNKFNNTLTGHLKDIEIPRVTDELDYEVELGVVIGKQAKYISADQALEHIFGYCTVNDLSARDLQMKTPQWLLGKTCDDFSPMGPYLVTADEVGNPNVLQLKTTVNGEVRQDSNTSDMIFSVEEIVSYISQHMTLTPGDVILTGTPEGVVLGLPAERRVYIQPGDVITVEIEKVGSLTNRFIDEQ